MVNSRHSVKSSEWGTPAYLIEPAREVLGVIDLDPAASAASNETVKAEDYWSKDQDGLSLPWVDPALYAFDGVVEPVTVFLNPPTPAKDWWEKLMTELDLGHIKHAIFIGYSVEILQVTQNKPYRPCLAFPVCFFKKRVPYIDMAPTVLKDGQEVPNPNYMKPKSGMTHSSCAVYVPGTVDNTPEFEIQFSPLGCITFPNTAC